MWYLLPGEVSYSIYELRHMLASSLQLIYASFVTHISHMGLNYNLDALFVTSL